VVAGAARLLGIAHPALLHAHILTVCDYTYRM
jgi:hypothetical protein